MEVTRIN